MKKIRKVLATLLAVAMLAGISTSVMAEEMESSTNALENLRIELVSQYPSIVEQEAINKTIDSFMNQPEFDAFYSTDPNDAIENVRIAAMGAMSDTSIPYWLSNNIYGASAPLIWQEVYYWCGPTSVLQVLSGLGYSSQIVGNNNYAKISTLASSMGVTSASNAPAPYQLVSEINNYSPKRYYAIMPSSLDDFKSHLRASLFWDKPLILNASTKAISYYNGHESGHYIVLKGYNMKAETVVLADCNYSSKYYGEHTVSVNEAYNSILGKFLIRGYEGYA